MKAQQNLFFGKLGIMLLPIIILGVGCASSGPEKPIKSATEIQSKYKTMMVNVIPDGPASDKEVTQLSSMIVAKLHEINLFENIYLSQITPDAASDLILNVNILNISRVSYTKREWMGAFAGKAGVQFTATLIESKTNQPLGNFESEGKSGGHTFAGGTQQAIERAAEQIAEFINKSM